MKYYLSFLLFIFSNWMLVAQKVDLSSLNLAFEYYQLDNGLQVVIAPDDTSQAVSVEYWVKMGSAHETPAQYGLCHFFEHVTPYGFLNQKEKVAKLSKLRVGSNAQILKDFTRYYQEVKPEGLDLLLAYTADRLSRKVSDIKQEKVDYERIRVLKEIARFAQNPFWSAEGGMAINQAIFGKEHPYGHGAYGWVHLNEGFELSDFKDWFNQFYYLQRTTVFIVGKVDLEIAKTLVEKYFSNIQTRPQTTEIELKSLLNKKENKRPKTLELSTKAKANYTCLFWQIPAWGSPKEPAFRVLSQIIDQRLHDQLAADPLVEKYSSSDLLNLYQHGGQFGIYIAYKDLEARKRIKKHLRSLVRTLIKSGISEKELAMGISKELANTKEMQQYLGFEWSRTALLGKGLFFKKDPGFYYQQLEKMLQLNTQDVEAVIQQYLKKRDVEIEFISVPK